MGVAALSKRHSTNPAGKHPLFSGHLDVLKLLVARGADLGCKDRKGYGLLHTAAASGQIEVVKYLLRTGAEVRVLSTGAGG